jgi:hypothetical protein
MNTFEATHAKPGTQVCLYEDLGKVVGHHTDELNVTWIDFRWTDGSESSLPVDDAEDLKLARGRVYFELPEYSEPTSVVPERKRR